MYVFGNAIDFWRNEWDCCNCLRTQIKKIHWPATFIHRFELIRQLKAVDCNVITLVLIHQRAWIQLTFINKINHSLSIPRLKCFRISASTFSRRRQKKRNLTMNFSQANGEMEGWFMWESINACTLRRRSWRVAFITFVIKRFSQKIWRKMLRKRYRDAHRELRSTTMVYVHTWTFPIQCMIHTNCFIKIWSQRIISSMTWKQ